MISVNDARNIILEQLPPKQIEMRPLSASAGYVLAENVYSDLDLPPFDKSAMDGFAVRAADVRNPPVELELIETVPAGAQPTKSVKPGKTIKIMTGAPVPPGADAVVMKETTEEQDKFVRFNESIRVQANICYKGEDLTKGTRVLSAGTLLRPAEIGLLAAVGKARLKVFRKPTAAVLTTGDELVEITKKPKPAQIRNSNSYFLMAQLAQLGLAPVNLGIGRDAPEKLAAKIKAGLKYDILVLTGGVSAGDYDLVEPILMKLGVKILFNMVAIKPGKPFVFGIKTNANRFASPANLPMRHRKHLVFALPGNPVSAFVITEVFIRPAIAELTGNIALQRAPFTARLATGELKAANRTQYIPARYNANTNEAIPVTWHGSADLVGLTRANALLIIPPETGPAKPGDMVQVVTL